MNNQADLNRVAKKLHECLPALKKKYPIASMALFGSIVREDFDPAKSDVDILVEFNGRIGIEFMDLAVELEEMIGRKIDLVSTGGLKKPWWKEHILNQAVYV